MNNKGFTFIELLIVILISGILLGAIAIFVGRIFTVNREHYAQVMTTEDGRHNLQRMAHAIRNARNTIDADGEEYFWLAEADDYEIVFYSNIDGDDDVKKVRYFLEEDTLMRRVTRPNPDGKYPPGVAHTTTMALARGIRNLENQTPMFRYYSAGSGEGSLMNPSTMSLASVKRVVINLIVDSNTQMNPQASVISTQVTPRRLIDPVGVENERLEPISISLPAPGDSTALITWPLSGDSQEVSVLNLNSRLTTYHLRKENWTTRLDGEWRIKVNFRLSDNSFIVDTIPLDWLKDSSNGCLAPEYNDVSFVLDNCENREISNDDGDTVQYQPVFLYTNPHTGFTDYVQDIEVQ